MWYSENGDYCCLYQRSRCLVVLIFLSHLARHCFLQLTPKINGFHGFIHVGRHQCRVAPLFPSTFLFAWLPPRRGPGMGIVTLGHILTDCVPPLRGEGGQRRCFIKPWTSDRTDPEALSGLGKATCLKLGSTSQRMPSSGRTVSAKKNTAEVLWWWCAQKGGERGWKRETG